MKRTFGLLLLVAALSTGALAIAGDTSNRSDQCPQACASVCDPGSCGPCGPCN